MQVVLSTAQSWLPSCHLLPCRKAKEWQTLVLSLFNGLNRNDRIDQIAFERRVGDIYRAMRIALRKQYPKFSVSLRPNRHQVIELYVMVNPLLSTERLTVQQVCVTSPVFQSLIPPELKKRQFWLLKQRIFREKVVQIELNCLNREWCQVNEVVGWFTEARMATMPEAQQRQLMRQLELIPTKFIAQIDPEKRTWEAQIVALLNQTECRDLMMLFDRLGHQTRNPKVNLLWKKAQSLCEKAGDKWETYRFAYAKYLRGSLDRLVHKLPRPMTSSCVAMAFFVVVAVAVVFPLSFQLVRPLS